MLLLPASPHVYADSGVLIPRDKQQPDPAILSLEEMSVSITIDNGDARVLVTQIFANHTDRIEEGSYVFALPSGSTVSDFATWDGPVRIPAVILERKRAEEIYDNARLQAIDPGLLEAGERDGSDPKATSTFSAKIVPIPAYGTKRLELEYHQVVPSSRYQQTFLLPLQPTAYQKAVRQALSATAGAALRHPDAGSSTAREKLTPEAHATGRAQRDWELRGRESRPDRRLYGPMEARPGRSRYLSVTTYRNPNPGLPSPDEKTIASTDASLSQVSFWLRS